RCGHRLRRRATRSRRAFAPAAIGRHRGPPAPQRGRVPLDGRRDRPGAVHPLRRDEEMTAPFTLAGRVAVVTGGYGVLGGAIAAGGNVARARSDNRPVFDVPLDALDEALRLNLHGTLIPSLIFGEVMGRQGSGCIVNISSMAARRALSGVLAYSIAKAGIDTL